MTAKNIIPTFEETLVVQHQQDSHYRFTLELGLFIVFLLGAFMVNINDLNYNTLFLDEAIYASVGEDLLQGIYSHNAVSYLFGSYLYPALSGIINKIGGVIAIRFASAILMGLASVFVYLTTKILFGYKAGLFSMILFSFNGNILNLSQLAVYDALALPFLAASLFLLVMAAASREHQRHFILASSICAILTVLSKYIGLIYMPALFITAVVLFVLTGTPLRHTLVTLIKYFVFPIVQALSVYTAFYWDELIQVFQEQGFSSYPQWLVLKIIGQEIGFILLFALAGLALLIFAIIRNRDHNSQLLFLNEKLQFDWRKLTLVSRILFFALFLLLLSTWLAAPLHHLITMNSRSLWKNCAYSLVFLSPLAGYCVAATVQSLRARNLTMNVIGIISLCAGIFYFADKALDSNWSFHHSWPNIENEMAYLQKAGLNENSLILAEGMNIYEYYFASEIAKGQVWDNFWYMEYGGLSGQEGALAAIQDGAPDFVIIDDYYFPGIRERITPLLAEAGYVLGWQEEQILRTGETILLQVFILGDGGAQ
ncbi:MAG: glycosyltransferase family 39 protein [Anaerolineales bacterium]|nr:glycosyltransferase family 39 protein [Anaerolineales bacterium]